MRQLAGGRRRLPVCPLPKGGGEHWGAPCWLPATSSRGGGHVVLDHRGNRFLGETAVANDGAGLPRFIEREFPRLPGRRRTAEQPVVPPCRPASARTYRPVAGVSATGFSGQVTCRTFVGRAGASRAAATGC